MTIGQRIAELRKKKGLSQEALGEELGVSRQAISKWESDASLPEVDKLIAMSRLFDVTVGYLLGVEEAVQDGQAPKPEGEDAPGDTASTEAEVLERYLNSLPKEHPVSRRRALLGAAVLILVLVLGFNCIRSLSSRVAELNNQVINLNNQVVGVYSELNGISDSVTTQVRSALEQEYGVLSAQELSLDSADFQNNTADIILTAVLKERVEEAAGISFFAMLPDGDCVPGTIERWDGDTSSLSARVTVPLENDISYFLGTPSATVALNADDSGVTWLWNWLGVSVSGLPYFDAAGDKTAQPEITVTAAMEDGGQLEAEVSLWLEVNGRRIEQFTNVHPAELNNSVSAAVDVSSAYQTVDESFTADPLNLEGFSPQPGDLVTVSYEVTLADGRNTTGWLEDGLRWDEKGAWNPVWINERDGSVEMEW